MATIERYSGDQFPHVLMGTGGTAGDLIYLSTGTGLTVKSNAAGTGVVTTFAGVLENTTTAGSYGAVSFASAFQLPKYPTSTAVEVGQLVYVATQNTNEIGTLDTGTAIGVCVNRSAAADSYITMKPIPFFDARANG